MEQVETKVDVLAVMDSCTDELEKQPGCYYTDAAKLQEARAAVAVLIEAANRAAVAAVRGDDNRPGTIRNADLDALRAALARVSGGAA